MGWGRKTTIKLIGKHSGQMVVSATEGFFPDFSFPGHVHIILSSLALSWKAYNFFGLTDSLSLRTEKAVSSNSSSKR